MSLFVPLTPLLLLPLLVTSFTTITSSSSASTDLHGEVLLGEQMHW